MPEIKWLDVKIRKLLTVKKCITPKLKLTGCISEDLTEERDCYNWN